MNILVIGGNGFVGQYFVHELSKDSKNTISVVSRNIHNDQYLPFYNLSNVNVCGGFDIVDYSLIAPFFVNQDIVFNLAGFVSFRQKDIRILHDINYTGALNVLKACEEMKVKKLIHVASTAALGFGNFIIDETHHFDWTKYKKCVYSISKFLPLEYIRKSSCNSIIVFPSLVLGPGDTTNTLHLIDAIKKGKIPFNPPGSNSIVDVRDLARALVLLMVSPRTYPEYIVSGGSYTFKHLNTTIARVLGVKAPIGTLPYAMRHPLSYLGSTIEIFFEHPPITYENMYLSFKHRKHDTSRLRILGFEPRYSLDQTIRDAVQWTYALSTTYEKK